MNVQLTDLKVNHEHFPIGITKFPQFSWQIIADEAFSEQAYRVTVASSPELILTARPDVFDSGWVSGSERFYDGTAFPETPFARYYWRVSVKNAVNETVTDSSIASFVTGPFHRSQWKSPFVFQYGLWMVQNRRLFTLRGQIDAAFLFVASCGERSNAYVLTLNGERISGTDVRPGPLEYMTAVLSGYDVTSYLRENNVLNVDVVTSFSAVLKVFYADGTTDVIMTDDEWQRYTGPSFCREIGYEVPHDQAQHGKYEAMDATLICRDWYDVRDVADRVPSFSCYDYFNRYWGPVSIRYDGVKTRAAEELTPISVRRLSDRENGEKAYLLDFGTNQSGYVRLTMHNCHNKITVRYGEAEEADGISTKQFADEYLPHTEYTPRGDETETYTPMFMHTGFRFVQIESADFVPDTTNVRGLFICSETDGKSHFTCSEPTLDYEMRCIRRSCRSNLFNVSTDCPGRERRGWSADSFAVIEAESVLFYVENLYERWFADLRDSQRTCGWVPVEYPDTTSRSVDLSWPMHTIINPYVLYLYTGDRRILTENLLAMERYADLLYDVSDGHLLEETMFTYGDWMAIERAGRSYLGTALYVYVTGLMIKTETILGNTEKAATYRQRYDDAKAVFNETFLRSDGAGYDNGSQSANVLALAFDLVPPEFRSSVFQALVNDVENKHKITVGFIANTWLYKVLAENGRNDLALSLLTDDTYAGASLPHMVNATRNETLSESFTYFGNSLNHAFLGGGAGIWLTEYLAGLQPSEPAYKRFSVRPYINGQTLSLSFSVQTPCGTIAVSWHPSEVQGMAELTVSVPPDTACDLILPEGQRKLSPGTYVVRTAYV